MLTRFGCLSRRFSGKFLHSCKPVWLKLLELIFTRGPRVTFSCLSLTAAPAQRLALQNIRALSTSSSLLNQGKTYREKVEDIKLHVLFSKWCSPGQEVVPLLSILALGICPLLSSVHLSVSINLYLLCTIKLMCIGSTPPVPATTTTKERGPVSKFLFEKTGVTGAWTLGLGFAAFLVSKEYYIINAEVP